MFENCTQWRSFSCDGPRNAISIVVTITDERRQIDLETFSTTVEEIFLSCFLEFPCAVTDYETAMNHWFIAKRPLCFSAANTCDFSKFIINLTN